MHHWPVHACDPECNFRDKQPDDSSDGDNKKRTQERRNTRRRFRYVSSLVVQIVVWSHPLEERVDERGEDGILGDNQE